MNNKTDLVWYACYGSNLCRERFLCYITGEPFEGKTYNLGCSDHTLPRDDRPVLIPYELYFGNSSHTWGGCGVAFLDTSKPGTALGRMYLITAEQYAEVRDQEGRSSAWYNAEVPLGTVDGYPIFTFTNSNRRTENAPSARYLDVIRRGLAETYPQLVLLGIGKNKFESGVLNEERHGTFPFELCVEISRKDNMNYAEVIRREHILVGKMEQIKEISVFTTLWKEKVE